MKTTTVKLSEPLRTHKGVVESIVLNEPRYREFRQFGEPYKITLKGDDVRYDYDDKACGDFLAAMSGIDVVTLEVIAASDYLALRDAMTGLLRGIAGDRPLETSAEPQ